MYQNMLPFPQIHLPPKILFACGEHQFFCIGLSRGYTIFIRYAYRERCSVHAEGTTRLALRSAPLRATFTRLCATQCVTSTRLSRLYTHLCTSLLLYTA